MDIPDLKAFVSVAHHRSFSKAAAALHISQPAISRRVQSLEHNLGQQLFDREGQQILLSAAGQQLLPKANEILQLVNSAETSLRTMGEIIQGPLTIAVSHYFAEHYLAPLLSEFRHQHPKVHFHFNFVESEVCLKQVLHGSADLGLGSLPSKAPNKLQIYQLTTETLHLVAHPHHTIFEESAPLQRLGEHLALLPPLESFTGQVLKTMFEEHSITIKEQIECNSMTSLKSLLISGLGWGVLPFKLVDTNTKMIEPKPSHRIERHIGLCHHKSRSLSPAARAFIDMSTLADTRF